MREKNIYRSAHEEIIDHYIGKERVRAFYQNDALHSAMYVSEDKRDVLIFPYMRYFDGAFVLNPGIRKTLVIGGGMFVYPRHLAAMGLEVDVAEINPAYIQLARKYFFVSPEKERLFRLSHGDGREFVRRHKKQYDAIFMDAFSGSEPSPSLTSCEAAHDIRDALKSGGVYVVNFPGYRNIDSSKHLKDELLTLKTCFPHVLAVRADMPDEDVRTNYVLFASMAYGFIEGMCEYGLLDHAELIYDKP